MPFTYTPWSINLPQQIGKQLMVPSLAFYTCVRSTGWSLFSASPLSLAMTYSKGGKHLSLDLTS